MKRNKNHGVRRKAQNTAICQHCKRRVCLTIRGNLRFHVQGFTGDPKCEGTGTKDFEDVQLRSKFPTKAARPRPGYVARNPYGPRKPNLYKLPTATARPLQSPMEVALAHAHLWGLKKQPESHSCGWKERWFKLTGVRPPPDL